MADALTRFLNKSAEESLYLTLLPPIYQLALILEMPGGLNRVKPFWVTITCSLL